MVNLSGVGVEFGTQELYRDVSLFIGSEDRVGLVGPNGSGKSTIMKLIAGLEMASIGRVEMRKGTRVAYLPQTGGIVSERTVLEEALGAFGHLEQVHAEMLEVEHRMKESGLEKRELDGLLARYSELQHAYHADAFDSGARAKKVLASLGFTEADMEKRLVQASGGFQVRAMLARILLSEPDLLLLDEPTNYLDIRAIEWLQGYLTGFRGAVLMVAHDRYFLDGLVERIWAIEGHRVLDFPGNYSEYLADRERRDEQQQKAYEEQQQFIKKTEQFVAQFKARKDTAKRAQSRQKVLDKLERIEAPRVAPTIRIRFPEAGNVYGKAFELRGVAKGYGGRELFRDVNLAVAGGEKLGIFGPNGAGKTTLLRLIAGRLDPDRGEVWRSEKTEVAYYEQGAEELLDDRSTVLDAVGRSGGGYTENELKGILGMFLFPGDMVEKKVRVLSGGERSRLAIICALLAPSNLLILDEPTNHLDIQSREMLFRAMSQYR
ncbi:ABC-F family ATP-binding cassette domain-containing protein, partial [candidate division WOR-3 bacterium]|nr:ABC-F family ATP-binding cassette domain-containing protein [candidate division WOR-3 bacterium]